MASHLYVSSGSGSPNKNLFSRPAMAWGLAPGGSKLKEPAARHGTAEHGRQQSISTGRWCLLTEPPHSSCWAHTAMELSCMTASFSRAGLKATAAYKSQCCIYLDFCPAPFIMLSCMCCSLHSLLRHLLTHAMCTPAAAASLSTSSGGGLCLNMRSVVMPPPDTSAVQDASTSCGQGCTWNSLRHRACGARRNRQHKQVWSSCTAALLLVNVL